MLARSLIVTAISLVVMTVIWACVPPFDDDAEPSQCQGSCPEGYEEVDRCPAFVSCVEEADCDEPLICAPSEAVGNQSEPRNTNAGPDPLEELDCDEVMECPEGTVEVSHCTEEDLCTRLNLCDQDLLCRELPILCIFEPLCPDGDRPMEDCEHEDCYHHRHCSGPVECLHCHEETPRECPEGYAAIEAAECIGEGLDCEQVETCDETLHCTEVPVECIEEPRCPGDTNAVDSCGYEGGCFTIDGCEERLVCQAPYSDCNERPSCPDEYDKVDIDACLDHIEECRVVTECGYFVGCLPN